MSAPWPTTSIGELFDIGAGKSVTPASRGQEPKRPFLRTSNVLWGRFDLADVDAMFFTGEEFFAKSLRRGDLLVCEGGDIGRAAVWEGQLAECSFQNHLHRLRPKRPSISPEFYQFALEGGITLFGLIEGVGNRTTIPNLSRSRLAELAVPLPPFDEQRKIAVVLGKVQSAAAVEGDLVRVARELKQAALRQLFTRGLGGEPQKQSEIGLIPESWKTVPLGEQALKISKGSSPKWQGFQYVSEGVLFVRSQNVGEGVMDWSSKAYLPLAWNAKEPRSVLKKNDVLLNLVGASIGRSAVGGPEIEGANCNQAVCFVRLKPDGLSPAFVASFLNSSAGLAQMHQQKKDVARANLSLDDVRGFRVPKPPEAEQREIAALLATLDAKIAHHEVRQTLLRELFRTLLHDLLTARRRVTSLDLDHFSGAGKMIPAAAF